MIKKNVNISNALSLSRIALMPSIIFCLKEEQGVLLLLLMLAAVATDYLDGYLARRFNQVSDLGRILDPMADKICINSMVVALSIWRGFPWWASILIIVRDILILLGGLVLVKKTKVVPVSNWPGKVTSTVLAMAIIFYSFDIDPWQFIALAAGIILVVISGLIYLKDAIVRNR